MNHHACAAFGKWEPSKVENHPKVKVKLTVARKDQNSLQLTEPELDQPVVRKAVTDTGAMMVVVDAEVAEATEFARSRLIQIGLRISAANNSKMVLLVAALVKISG